MAFGLRIANGFSLGLYILIYTAVVGALGVRHIDSFSPTQLGLLYVICIYCLCYFLEVWAGAVGDAFGTRVAMTFSYMMKTMFFLSLILIVLYPQSRYIFWSGISISIISMSLHYTLFSGNFEAFLLKMTDNPEKATRAFGKTLAWKHCATILGAIIALYYLSDYSKDEGVLISEYVIVPFTIGCLICIVFSLLSYFGLPKQNIEDGFLVSSSPKVSVGSIRKIAYKKLNSGGIFSNLKRLYFANATIYGLLQCLSVIIPLWVIFSDFSFVDQIGILALAQYFPSVIGALISTLYKGKKESIIFLNYELEVRRIKNLTILLCTAIGIFSVLGILNPNQITLLIFFVCLARGTHAIIQPRLEHLITDIAQKNNPNQKRSLISINRKWEKIGGILGIGLAIAVKIWNLSSDDNFLLYSLLSTAIFALLITIIVLQPISRQFQTKDSRKNPIKAKVNKPQLK